jgi:glucose/arabinose dehydrogenase
VIASGLVAGVAVGAAAVVAAGSAGSDRGGLRPIGAGLQGPRGLRATVYARAPKHLAAFALDRSGRLWLSTAGLRSHRGDGVYVVPRAGARPVAVVRGLDAPLGLAWVGGTLYVSSLGKVTAFRGLRGDRFAVRRTILVGPPGGGENNNLVRAPDGRLVLGVSASCDHCRPRSRWSGSIVSFRLDGGDLRLVARGLRAPFGLAYYPGTDDLFATLNQRDDLGARTPGDWLGLVGPGQDWGFPACYGQAGAACRGVPKPVGVLDRHAAAGGVAIVAAADALGAAYAPSALVAEWQLGKVQRVALTRAGSGFRGSVSPFLRGLENPLPLLATPDGAVLVGDWGTGRIYRVARR